MILCGGSASFGVSIHLGSCLAVGWLFMLFYTYSSQEKRFIEYNSRWKMQALWLASSGFGINLCV